TVFTGKNFSEIDNPHFLQEDLELLRKKSKTFSRKKRGSNNRKKSKKELLDVYKNISNRRSDWQWKLAHALCKKFKFIGLEDLNIKSMQMIWGRKISDLAHSEFVFKLKHVAKKYGTVIQEVDRFYASSKTCSKCQNKKKNLELKERTYHCDECGYSIDRDRNASINIRKEAVRIYAQIKKTG
ncbi:MAG: RNA-guided endonuclease InsQ/TnpB family protein, partial [Chitinophagales bacterium]